MFLADEQTKDTGLSLSDAIGAAKKQIQDAQQTIFDFETKFMKINREVLGQTGKYANIMTAAFADSYGDVVRMGGSLDDIANTFSSINKSMQSNTILSSEQLTNFIALEKSAGMTADQMGEMVEAFDTIGYGVDATIETLDSMATKARSLGLNVATFMGTVAKNIKLVNAYNYKDGVEGFTRMVARAQALRIDMTQVNKLAGDLLNPEKAIELAAEFQNLGGSIGALGDPFQLMNMAQNDMEGLQNAIVDAAKSSVMFNKETGKYQISATEMRRLRAQADALGMSYEDLANTAVKARQEQQAMDELRFTDLSDEQKQLVSNLAQVGKNGQMEIKLPNGELMDISKLTSDQISKFTEDLKKQDETNQLDAIGVAKEQLGSLREIASILGGGAAKMVGGVALSETFNDFKESLVNVAESIDKNILQGFESTGIAAQIDESIGGPIKDLLKDATDGILQMGVDFRTNGFDSITELFTRLLEQIQNPGSGGGSGTGTGLNSAQTTYSRANQGLEITPTTNNVQKIEITDLTVNHSGTIRLEGLNQTIDFSTLPETEIRILSERIKRVLSPELLGSGV